MNGRVSGLTSDTETEAATRFALRILATTDLHMHVLPFDYLTDRPSRNVGLARTASLIQIRRRHHPNTLLFDNGDFLQGSPLGDFVAHVGGVGPRNPHPAVAAMNAIGYDAATLGNHDFSYGVGFLMRALEGARFPFTLANVTLSHHRAPPRWLILDREIEAMDGTRRTLRVGVIGLVPPQTVEWDRQLHRDMACTDIVDAARAEVPRLRAAGADLVVALAHTGIGDAEAIPGMENAATALAALPGIDAVVAGHTHQVFPDEGFPDAPGVDRLRGTLAGKPAVMAGFGGSHLGIIDLDLRRDPAGRWTVEGFVTRAEPVAPDMPVAAEITNAAKRHHSATRRHLRRRIARTHEPMTSYFSLIGDDPGLHLVAKAQRWHVRRALRGTEWEGLPILSASAPFRAGGRGGPEHYTCVEAGRLTERNLADLYLFPNRICAVEMRGADLAAWLERSASIFNQIRPGDVDAPLIDGGFPSYNFDVIDGLTWDIDLSRPARYAADGTMLDAGSHRIGKLCHRGETVTDDQRFVLATNSFRLAACGLFAPLVARGRVALRDESPTRAVLRRYLRLRRTVELPECRPWQFRTIGATALFETHPRAEDHLGRLSLADRARMAFAGMSETGFARFRLSL